MSEITLTINGKEATGQQGDTILAVCERAGIDLPTLCHLKGVHDIGTCRMCIVELADSRVVTACTTPAEPGMAVTTESDRLTAIRRSTLELLFAERNHYCMFCAASGDCELQDLAYRLGMDHVRYPSLFPRMEADTSHEHKVFDQNRCILCRRCLRACNELVANHTLGIRDRGIHSMLSIDGGEPFADSTCASCEKANSRGAAAAGLPANGVDWRAAKAILCLAGDDPGLSLEALGRMDGQLFLVVHSAYRTLLTERADVVLPAPAWFEKNGTMINAQGQEVHLRAAIEPPPGARDESEVLMALSS